MRMIKLLSADVVKAMYAQAKTDVDVELKTQQAHQPRTHKLCSHALDSLYPLTLEQGSIGRYHPSKIPGSRVTNSSWVGDYARTYGVRSRPWRDPFTPIRPKKQ